MQVFSTQCPYCNHNVDSTIEHLDGPVLCPKCEKPFEMEMPTAVVTSVRELHQSSPEADTLASGPEERILAKVHPVVFRARPIASLVLVSVLLICLAAMVLSLSGGAIAGFTLSDANTFGSSSLLMMGCAIVLLIGTGIIGYWVLLSRFTELTITDDRTIYQEGIVSRETSEVQHDDVRNIQLDQSFAQRLLKVGGIGISSSGQDDLEVVAKRLPRPERLIKLVRDNQD